MNSANNDRALTGFRVLDFSAMIAGPYCTRWLADLGADVIKVEPPEGEMMRSTSPLRDGHSSYFGQLNAGKRCIALDLKDPQAMAAIVELIKVSDVLVENFRPGVMQRLGLGFAQVHAVNPRLVYCSISGYGQSGELSDRPAYAPIVHAASGYEMAQFSFQDDVTQPSNCGLFAADVLAASFATIAIQSALLQRSRTGRGQHLDVTLMESIASVLIYELQEAQFPAKERKPLYEPIRSSDGFVVIAPISQKNFENLCDVMAMPQWKSDPRFSSTAVRRQHWQTVLKQMREWAITRTSAQCETLMLAAGVPCSGFKTIADMLNDPHFRIRGSFSTVQDAAGSFQSLNPPFQMSDASCTTGARVATIGQHTREVLCELAGYTEAQFTPLAGQ